MSTVTETSIKARIRSTVYKRIEGTTVTLCVLTMVNGFVATGESACVNPEHFDAVKGQEIAYANAFDKLWAFEGYLACETRYREAIGK